MQTPEDLSHALLSAAKAAGADAADALVVQATSTNIDVRAGKLERAERTEELDLGLRVFVGQQQASVSISDISPDTLSQMAERAVAMAKDAPVDPYAGLADPDQLAERTDMTALEIYDDAKPLSARNLQELASRSEAAALTIDGVSQTQGASAAQTHSHLHLAATNGFSAGYQRNDSMISCVAIAGEGLEMEREYDGDYRVFLQDLRSPEDIGILAGTRAVERTGAKKPPSGSYPVVFDERISSSLIAHLLAAINGAAIARGNSWLLDAMGTQVLPETLSLEANPHRPRVSGSRLFDAEGLPTRPRLIVENGVLQSWTLDLATSRKLGIPSTANAQRGTSGPPNPGISNVALSQGTQSRAELLDNMGTGLLVTGLIGATINPNTGDYSRGASGFWVENGEITYPVNECTIAGNLIEMLRTVTPANDARLHLSRVVPSLIVEGLTIAGA
ncbi:MAG: TldD/PmbA family protein [Pseudomonadota bacterium]